MKWLFEDLQFNPLQDIPDTEEANLELTNGYSVKVWRGKGALHSYGAPYELTSNPIPNVLIDESVGYLDEKSLMRLINELQNLPRLNWV